jgi:hypothetical protein
LPNARIVLRDVNQRRRDQDRRSDWCLRQLVAIEGSGDTLSLESVGKFSVWQ